MNISAAVSMGDSSQPIGTSIRVLGADDIAGIELSPDVILHAVRTVFQDLGNVGTSCPRKIKMDTPSSVSYSMVARHGTSETVGFKTSFTHWLDDGGVAHRGKYYATMLTLYDDVTGAPLAMMDCGRIGALRTAAVTALLAQEAGCEPETAMVIGSGIQGQMTPLFLLAAFPSLSHLVLAGSYPRSLERARDEVCRYLRTTDGSQERTVNITLSATPGDYAAQCDLIVGAAGPASGLKVKADELSGRTTVVVVGYGIDASICRHASRVIATSEEQMAITGVDFAETDGTMPPVDAELAELIQRTQCLGEPHGTVFCYNSGLALTDIAVGVKIVHYAQKHNIGAMVKLW